MVQKNFQLLVPTFLIDTAGETGDHAEDAVDTEKVHNYVCITKHAVNGRFFSRDGIL